jgi:uncharacterized protein
MAEDEPGAAHARRFKGLQGALDRAFSHIAVWSGRHTGWVLGMAFVLLLVGVYGASTVRMDNSLDSYFDETDPAFQHYKNYIQEFSSDEVIYLLYSVPGREHGPFDLNVMKQIDRLTRAIEAEVPFVRKVTSLTNVEFIEADGDFIEIHALMEDFPEAQSELLRLRDLAVSKPLYVGSVVSKDATHAAVVVEMSRTSTDPVERLRLDPQGGDDLPNLYPQAPDDKVRKILARPEYQGIDFKISGDVPMNSAYNVLMGRDIANLTMLTLVLVGVMSVFFLGVRPTSLFAPLIVVVLSLVLTLGFMGFMGWKVTLFFLMVPTLLCAMGVAQAVHVLLAWQHNRAVEPDRIEAVRRTIMKVGTPCLLVAGTDAIGFAGMGVSHLRSLDEMSKYAAFGVMMTFVLTLTLLIAFAARSTGASKHPRPAPAIRWLDGAMPKLVAFNLKHYKTVLVVFAAILAVAATGIAKLKVDFNFLTEFKPHIEWRQHSQYINDNMGGLLSVVYLFDTGKPDGIKDVELLREIEGLQKVAESQPVAQDSVSVVDIVKELNQAFHGGDPSYYRLPEDRETLSQLLLVYELSGGKEMNDVLNLDRSKTALQVRLKLVASSEVRAFMGKLDEYLEAHPLKAAKVEVSGIGYLWVKIAQYVSDTQLKGYALTFGLIMVTMMLAFGSIRLGMLAMVPNLFPIALVLGCMGWLGWHLDYYRLLLATIAIGIAVDDTIHFNSCYKREFEHCGRYREALARTLPQVGAAMVSMTAILVVAMSAYYASSLAIIASFGFLLTLTIAAAAVCDLLLMPGLLLWLKPFGAERADAREPVVGAATVAP